jgi:Mce-associated membrane protein
MTRAALRPRKPRVGKEDAVPIDTETTTENPSPDFESGPIKDSTPVEGTEPNSDHGEPRRAGIHWGRMLAYGVLPGLALIVAMAAGYLKWSDSALRDSQRTGIESVHAATDGTVAMLSYRPDSVEKDLGAARDRLSGNFKGAYTSLIHDVVIPGSRQQQISAVATVPAAASVSASDNHAVVLVFVDQTITVGSDPPTNTASRVRVTLDKVGGRWLIADFDPI